MRVKAKRAIERKPISLPPLRYYSEMTGRRRGLELGGFSPIPLNGKAPSMTGWQKLDASLEQIEAWERNRPEERNTGILTKYTPTLDIDVFNSSAATAVERLARARFGGRGTVLTRIGLPPKRAILFRTDRPFSKIIVNVIAPDGATGQKIEFLADGQQVVCFGIHPDTKRPYTWHGGDPGGGEPGIVPHALLPAITEAEAKAFVADAVQLIGRYGYRPADTTTVRDDDGKRVNWEDKVASIIKGTDLHDGIRDLAASLVASGASPGVAKGILRATMNASTAPRDSRWQERYDDIGRAVESAQEKFGGDWPEPKPLPNGLAPVAAFDSKFLPNALAPWVDDIAERLQCPPDYVGVSAITALGSVIGRRVGIQPQEKTDWIEYANQWGAFIGRPGMLKSPAMMEALKPLHHLETEAAKDNEIARAAYKANLDAFKLRQQVKISLEKMALKKGKGGVDFDVGGEPEEPAAVRYRTNDSSYEALGELLINNPTGLLLERDELVSLLQHLDREEQTMARSFFMSGWSGKQPYTFDRIIRGHLHIEAVCLSVLGNTQPARISKYVRRANLEAGGDGLIQRFGLLVWPDISPEWHDVDEYPDSKAREQAWRVFLRASELTEDTVRKAGAYKGQFDKTPHFRFEAAAREQFVDWHSNLEHQLRNGELSPALEGHFAKYRKLLPSLALINHLADGGEGAVGREALGKAIAFSVYLESHARRVYGAADMVELAAAQAILTHIRKGELKDGFTTRDVHRHGWSNLTEHEWVQAGLNLLVDLDYVAENRSHRDVRGGRPKVTYAINPRILN